MRRCTLAFSRLNLGWTVVNPRCAIGLAPTDEPGGLLPPRNASGIIMKYKTCCLRWWRDAERNRAAADAKRIPALTATLWKAGALTPIPPKKARFGNRGGKGKGGNGKGKGGRHDDRGYRRDGRYGDGSRPDWGYSRCTRISRLLSSVWQSDRGPVGWMEMAPKSRSPIGHRSRPP